MRERGDDGSEGGSGIGNGNGNERASESRRVSGCRSGLVGGSDWGGGSGSVRESENERGSGRWSEFFVGMEGESERRARESGPCQGNQEMQRKGKGGMVHIGLL